MISRMKAISISVMILMIFTLSGCGIKGEGQQVRNDYATSESTTNINSKTISDKIKEYGYTISGTIELPLNENVYLFSHYIDLVRTKLSNAEDSNIVSNINTILSDQYKFKRDFAEKHQNILPLVDSSDNSIIESNVKFWISKQLKFTTIPLANASKKMMLTLKDVTIDKTSVVFNSDQTITVKFQANCDGIREIDPRDTTTISDDSDKLIKEGETITVPLNLFKLYYKTVEMEDFYSRNIDSFLSTHVGPNVGANNRQLLDLFQNMKDKRLNGNSGDCYTEGSYFSPNNNFYYFNYNLNTCKVGEADLTKLVVTKSIVKKPDYSIFPEYHRLFASGKTDVFIFFNKVGNEAAPNTNALIRKLLQSGYTSNDPNLPDFIKVLLKKLQEVGDGSGLGGLLGGLFPVGLSPIEQVINWIIKRGEFKFTKLVENSTDHSKIALNITIVLAENFESNNAYELFTNAIARDDIIFYDGHAGYGVNINEYFTKAEGYPKDKYQIIFLDGCATYFYGVSEILTAKAIRDADFLNHNVDLVSTYSSAYMLWSIKYDFIRTLELAAINYKKPATTWTEETKKELSWYSIISRINKLDTANAHYLVSGEQNNDYKPGKVKYERETTSAADNLNLLRDAIFNSSHSKEEKRKFFKYLLDQHIDSIAAAAASVAATSTETGSTSALVTIDELTKKTTAFCKEFVAKGGSYLLEEHFYTNSCIIKNISSRFDIGLDGDRILAGSDFTLNDQGKIASVKLTKNTTIQGKIFRAKSTVNFHTNGKVKSGQLAENIKIISRDGLEIELSKSQDGYGNEIQFYENGMIFTAKLAKDITPIGSDIKFLTGHQLYFLEDGQISPQTKQDGVLIVDKVLNNRLIKAGTRFRYNDGEILVIENSSDMTIEEMIIPAQSQININKNGKIDRINLSKNTTIQGRVFKEKSDVTFYDSGKVKSGLLSGDSKFTLTDGSEIEISTGDYNTVYFYDNGIISSADLAKDAFVTAARVPLKKDTIVTISPNGHIISGTLASDFAPAGQGFKYVAKDNIIFSSYNKIIYFLENGQISSRTKKEGILTVDKVLNNRLFKAGTRFRFNEDGTLNVMINFFFEMTIDNIAYARNSTLKFYPNGAVAEGKLARDTKYAEGITLVADKSDVHFHDNKKISEAYIKENEIQGMKINPEQRVSFHRNGKIQSICLPQNSTATVNGIRYGNTSYYSQLRFHDNGNVAEGMIDQDLLIQDIKIKKGQTIQLHPDGTLAKAYIDNYSTGDELEYFVLDGMRFMKNREISFHPNKRVSKGYLFEEMIFDNIAIKGQHYRELELYDDGRLKSGTLLKSIVIDGLQLKAEEVIEVSREGKLLSGTLDNVIVKRGNVVDYCGSESGGRYGSRISFYENGNLKSCNLVKVMELNISDVVEEKMKVHKYIEFYQDGKIKTIVLAEPNIIEQNYILADQMVTFDQKGHIF
ncbi:MAG: hypothetical protein HQK49_18275 [Oligoflexia bacterium]|nr:hypothetical protein [Oligoflexia bacterium]